MIVNCAAYADGRRVADIGIDDVGPALEAGRVVWVGLYEPGEELMKKVQDQLHLHDLAVEDAHRAHQRPKLEEYGEDLFVVLRTAQLEGDEIAYGETHLFVGRNYVVSVRHGASLPYIDVRARCEQATDLMLQGGTWFILYALMDFVVDQYLPIVDRLSEQMESVEGEVFEHQLTRATLERIYSLKRDLVGIRHAMAPLPEMCHHLTLYEIGHVGKEVQLYFRDVYDHVVRMNQRIDNLRELLATMLEANLSLISIQQNDVMKKLAAWAAIFAVPTMIAGIYGMNFAFIPGAEWRAGFGVLVAVTFVICTILFVLFKRTDWL